MKGPEWIADEQNWPEWTLSDSKVFVNSVCEVSNQTKNEVTGIGLIIDICRFSTYQKLLCVSAYLLRFVFKCRRKSKSSGALSVSEIEEASRHWIRQTQQEHFEDVLENFNTTIGAKTLSIVKQLKLFKDENNILRCGGRIHNAPIRESAKFPVLLPLPADRLTDSSPFTVTGVDFTGALTVRKKNGEKTMAYICLFNCASTRAVHLEIVKDLSEDTFILAFRRFVSRKSLPKIMISDNATTYVAAAKEIERLTTSTLLIDQLNIHGTTWKFIPKRAPWYGGFYERLIGLTKNCIKKVLGRAFVSMEVLRTVITEVEAILNDRPLTYVSSDPIDEDPLTPSNLLYGRRIRTLPYTGVTDITDETLVQDVDLTHDSSNKLNRIKTQIIQHFWSRWRTEYLTALREYQRNNGKEKQNIKCGEVVQIHNETSRTNWTLAVVEKLIFGNDGFARSAIVRTKNGVTSRPITKLYPLEIISNLQRTTSCDLLNNRKSKIDAKEKIKNCTLSRR